MAEQPEPRLDPARLIGVTLDQASLGRNNADVDRKSVV